MFYLSFNFDFYVSKIMPTSGHDDSEVNNFYQHLQKTIDQTRTFWLYKGMGMLKLGRMHRQTGEMFVDPTAMSRQMREVSKVCNF